MKKIIVLTLSLGILSFSSSYANVYADAPRNHTIVKPVNDNISSLCKAAMQGDVAKVKNLNAPG